LKVQIIEEIELIASAIGQDDLLVELHRVGDALFDIASGNSFYSHMYATLYKELMIKYDFMKTIFKEKINSNSDNSLFKDFEYCDPNKDYDAFCKNNKTNEKRRALALFYVNLMLQDIIPTQKIVTMIDELQTDLISCIKKEGQINIVDEMSELIYILVIKGASSLKGMPEEWTDIVDRIKVISEMKVKTKPSISNKTIFKHMDMKAALGKIL
jgi:hypothetical protein